MAVSLLAFWIGGASSPPVSTTVGGVRSLLAPWIGGASSPAGTPADQGGFRSLLAFWAGGAASGIVVPPEPEAPAVGGGGGKRHKRRRILRKTIYGTVISLWQEEHHERPPVAVARQITEQVAATYRDIEAEIAEIEIRTVIVRLMAQVIEEEDEETALFSMM